jgi:hypothetical protein
MSKSDATSNNFPNVVRKSFIDYLRKEFPYKKDWKHPINGTYSHDEIRRVISEYKLMNSGQYRYLWWLWTCQGSRSFIAEIMNVSSPTVRRAWDKSINVIMLMLYFPELKPDEFVLFDGSID